MSEISKNTIKRVFFIHANTEPVNINGKTMNIVVDFVVATGFVDPDYHEVFATKDLMVQFENYIPYVWWDTYDECEIHLAKMLAHMYHSYSTSIAETFNRLKEKYPERLI